MNKSENPRPNVEIMRASLEQKPVLANLLELYSHDFCDFLEIEIGPDGRFGYRDLNLYWTDPDRHPFLVYVDNRLAGFILIAGIPPGAPETRVWDVAEFFILRGYRRRGIGTQVAHTLWRRLPGHWQVRIMSCNGPAYRFWHRATKSFAGDEILMTRSTQAGKDWHRFAFESRPGCFE